MLQKTRGIVINFIRYRDTSVIVKIYTELLGLRSYLVNGIRNPKTARIALFQPLNLLDLVVYEKEKVTLNRIAEMQLFYAYQSIPFHPHKINISFFLTEILAKSLKEEARNPELFDFLLESLLCFDQLDKNYSNFHIQFLLKFSEFLGCALHSAEELQGQLVKAGYKLYYIEYQSIINELIAADFQDAIQLSGKVRTDILEYLVLFYSLHIENFGKVQSLEILKELY